MRKLWRGLGWTLGILLAVGLLLRLIAFEVWTMPDDAAVGASTAPALEAGDTVILLRRGTPGFGDLVRCQDPQYPEQFVIGRIAGVPGDDVETEGGKLMVNGRVYQSESACSEPKLFVKHPETLKEVELSCGIVQMGSGWHYRATQVSGFGEQKKTAHVGPDMLFLVSDNRAMHDDSRDFGLVQRSSCKERIVARLWSKAGWSDHKSRFSVIH
jgi:signal peptidase I